MVSSFTQALRYSSPTPLWGCACLPPLGGLLETFLPTHPKSTTSDYKLFHHCLGAIPIFLARLKACPEYKAFPSVPCSLHPHVSPRAEPFQSPIDSELAFIDCLTKWLRSSSLLGSGGLAGTALSRDTCYQAALSTERVQVSESASPEYKPRLCPSL